MCGRFASRELKELLAKLFRATRIAAEHYTPSFNVAPTEFVPIIREDADETRSILLARFGIPMVAGGKHFPLLNIQSEKSLQREDLKTRRCIIPASGFYEWKKISSKEKQPHYFSPKEGLFAFAGIWRQDGPQTSFAILTTNANEMLQAVHARMPVILGHNAVAQWLSPTTDKQDLAHLMEPYPSGLMQGWKVGKAVGSPRYKEEDCIKPIQ